MNKPSSKLDRRSTTPVLHAALTEKESLLNVIDALIAAHQRQLAEACAGYEYSLESRRRRSKTITTGAQRRPHLVAKRLAALGIFK
jgi:hypothetical protein